MRTLIVQCLTVAAATALGLGCKSAPKAGASSVTPPAAKASGAVSSTSVRAPASSQYPTLGSIERLDPVLNPLLPPGTLIEKLAEGFQWTEGPVWAGDSLLFSDIPANAVYRWKPGGKPALYIRPSGYLGTQRRGGEIGSNGLARDRQGRLVLCQHGDRCLARLEKDGNFTIFAAYYRLHRFNSPNDLVFKSNGDLYFTDPPYGLEGGNTDPKKEMPFNGVYRVKPSGEVTLLTEELTFPNGIAFSPDEKTLYVSVSDPKKPCIMAFTVLPNGNIAQGRVFFDATELAKTRKGLPDGLKVDRAGNLFATGPGGVLILSPAGQHLGTILTGEPTGNCAWGDGGSTLYITSNHSLLRVHTATRGPVMSSGISLFPAPGR